MSNEIGFDQSSIVHLPFSLEVLCIKGSDYRSVPISSFPLFQHVIELFLTNQRNLKAFVMTGKMGESEEAEALTRNIITIVNSHSSLRYARVCEHWINRGPLDRELRSWVNEFERQRVFPEF